MGFFASLRFSCGSTISKFAKLTQFFTLNLSEGLLFKCYFDIGCDRIQGGLKNIKGVVSRLFDYHLFFHKRI